MPTDRLARLYTTTSTVLNTHPHTWHGTRIQLPPASFLVLYDFSAGFARGLSESFTIFRASAVVLAQQATPKAAKVATRMTRTAAAAPTARGMDSPAHDARMHRWTRRSKSKTTRVPTLTWTSWTQAGRPGLLTQSPSTTYSVFRNRSVASTVELNGEVIFFLPGRRGAGRRRCRRCTRRWG
jgi:hypothetical protein